MFHQVTNKSPLLTAVPHHCVPAKQLNTQTLT